MAVEAMSVTVNWHDVGMHSALYADMKDLVKKNTSSPIWKYQFAAQNSNFSETESHLTEKMSSGFPSDVPMTALPQLCDSRRFLKATCWLPAG